MNPDFTLIWPLSCLKDGDHLYVSGPAPSVNGLNTVVIHSQDRQQPYVQETLPLTRSAGSPHAPFAVGGRKRASLLVPRLPSTPTDATSCPPTGTPEKLTPYTTRPVLASTSSKPSDVARLRRPRRMRVRWRVSYSAADV